MTRACVLLISINGENTAEGNGIPGNTEDMIWFDTGICDIICDCDVLGSLLQSGDDCESLVVFMELTPNFGSKKLFLVLFALYKK